MLTLKEQKGVAIIAVTMLMLVLGILATAVVSETGQDMTLANVDQSDRQALFLAESGLETAYQNIYDTDQMDFTISNQGLNGTYGWNGTYTVQSQTVPAGPTLLVKLTAQGASESGSRRVHALTEIIREDISVWNNAIFAGAGQAAGTVINGNVSIHGSVHILGDNLDMGDEALSAVDLNGTSLIHNNYGTIDAQNGIPSALYDRIPALPTETFEGEQVEDLDAKIRVKHGIVGLSGNSEIGEPNVAGNSFKETVDGVYVTDGYDSTAQDGDGYPLNIYSDNGKANHYDLADKVSFPLLDGAFVADYLSETGVIYVGEMEIETGNSFYFNSTRGHYAPEDADQRTSADDYIYYDASTNVLEISGQIYVNGHLEFEGHGSNRTIYYTGRGTLLVDDGNPSTTDVTINTDLLTVNNGDVNNYQNSFPSNALGIMTAGNMSIGESSQLALMGAFYSQDTTTVTKQTRLAGSIVSNYFDLGTNVPHIYHVPALSSNLPPGMIADDPVMVTTGFRQKSWWVN